MLPGCDLLPLPDQIAAVPFSSAAELPTTWGMNNIACSAVAQAGLSAATASLDSEAEWPLLLVAGWLTTAADLVVEATLRNAALALT